MSERMLYDAVHETDRCGVVLSGTHKTSLEQFELGSQNDGGSVRVMPAVSMQKELDEI